MNILFSLLKSKLQFLAAMIRDRDWALAFVVVSFLGIGILTALFVFAILFKAFRFLRELDVFGPALTTYALEASFALMFLFLFISSVSSALVIFFRSQELEFLLFRPLRVFLLFFYGFIKNYLISSWPILVIAIPAITALGAVYGGTPLFYISALAGVTIFSLGTILLGSGVAFLLGFILPRIHKLYLVLILLFLILGSGYAFSQSLVPVHFKEMFRAELVEEEIVSSADIERNFRFWPSHLLVNILRSFIGFEHLNLGLNMGALIIATLSLLAFVTLLALRTYVPLWAKFQETSFVARTEGIEYHRGLPIPISRIIPGALGIILEKDIAALVRNFTNIYSFGFILFLLVIYITTVLGIIAREGRELAPDRIPLVVMLVTAAVGYFAAILSLRFVFPAVSQEGRSAWVTWTSPFRLTRIIWAKFFFYGLLFSAVLGLIFFFSSKTLVREPFALAILMFFVLLETMTITAIALGFGARFPHFNIQDVERLSTTEGGLGTIFLAVIYITLTGFLTKLFLETFHYGSLISFFPLVALGAISLALMGFFLSFALRAVRYIR